MLIPRALKHPPSRQPLFRRDELKTASLTIEVDQYDRVKCKPHP